MEIPGYKVVRELGRGGMATVYLAEQEKFERQVALKVMASSLNSDPSFKERFIREAKLVARLSHPNIVAVYDVGEYEGHVYMAMEYHTGGDLKARIRAGMSPADSVRVTCEMARALEFAHSKGVIHRDIKPDNILFRSDGSAVLTDFGIAKQGDAQTQFTQMGMVAGTPKYMSPEQARGLPLDAESDLYSLGIVFYESLTGDVPFKAEDSIALAIKHLKDPPPPLPTGLRKFQPFLDRILAKEAARRYHRGGEVARVLEDIVASGAVPNLHKAIAPVQPVSQEATVVSAAVPGVAVGNTGAFASGGNRAGLAVGVVAVLALGGGAGWYFLAGPGAQVPEPEVVVAPEPEPAPVAVVAPPPEPIVEEPVAEPQPEPAVSPPPPPPAAFSPRGDAAGLIAKGNAALAEGRLDSPVGTSAYDYFRQALAVEPKNRKAQDGMHRIADRFIEKVDAAIAAGDFPQARQHLSSAERIAPGYRAVADAATRVVTAANAAAEVAAAAAAAEAAAKAKAALAAAAPPPEPVAAPVPTVDANAVRNRLRASGLASKGTTLLKQGDYASARSMFDQALALDPANQAAIDGVAKIKQMGM